MFFLNKKLIFVSVIGLTLITSFAQAATLTAPKKPAPPLSEVYVYSVTSPNCGTEIIDKYAMATTCDHGGSQLRVVVQEMGYGDNPVAWLDDEKLPASALYDTAAVCREGGEYVSPCDAGYSIIGWRLYYNLDGSQGGYFEFQDTSMTATQPGYATLFIHLSIL